MPARGDALLAGDPRAGPQGLALRGLPEEGQLLRVHDRPSCQGHLRKGIAFFLFFYL